MIAAHTRRRSSAPIPLLFAAGEQGIWLDPSDFSTMWQDSAGATLVTAVGQPVGKILDKSGRGNHAIQSNDVKRPTLQQDADGKYHLEFNGINSALETPSIDFTATDKMSIFCRMVNSSLGGVAVVAELSANFNSYSGSFYLVAGEDVGVNGWTSISRGTAGPSGDQAARVNSGQPDTAVLSITHDIAGSMSTMRRNAVAAVSSTGNKGTGDFGNYPIYIGGRTGSSYFFKGRMYAMVVRGVLSTAEQIDSVENYINSKT